MDYIKKNRQFEKHLQLWKLTPILGFYFQIEIQSC